jgi:DNA processing protein
VAERLAADLASHGLAIVSGLARGVDSAAHRGALTGGGVTIAVLGCGADVIYPREHEDLAQRVMAAGALLSELAPGTPPRAQFFPRRNRIISGLSRAVVIVEAGEKSGSLITARTALDQGREVLAVPGNVLTPRNRGGHALIRDGARIVETAADVLDELGYASGRGGSPAAPNGIPAAPAASTEHDGLLGCMSPGEPCPLDMLAAATGMPIGRLLTRLLDLELQGRIRRIGGAGFLRI